MTTANPPRWAEALLRTVLRPADRDAIQGDLLEEYRASRLPQLGCLRARIWYIKQVVSFVVRLAWPFAAVLAGLTLAAFLVEGARPGYGSPLPAPGISLMHAVFYLSAGFYGSRRTRLVRTGALTAGVAGFAGYVTFFTAAAADQDLFIVPFRQPFIFVILASYLLITLLYSVFIGTVAGVAGKWIAPPAGARLRASN